MPKRPYQIQNRKGVKKFNGNQGNLAPVRIGHLYSPSTSTGPVSSAEVRTEAQVKVIPRLMEVEVETRKQFKSAKKKKQVEMPTEEANQRAVASSSSLEYPDNDLLKRRIRLSGDPLDDIFDRFVKPRLAPPLIDLEGIEQQTMEMLETPRIASATLDATTTSDLTLVDADSTMGTSQLLQVDSDEDEIVCIGEKSADNQRVEVIEKVDVTIEEGEIVLDDDDEIVVVNETSMNTTNIRMEMLTTDPNEPTITANNLRTAAMEDSLVKGTCQEYGKLIRHWELVKKLVHKPDRKDTVIRICTYNILCQETINKTAYLYRHLINTPNEYQLYWEHRWPLLKQNLEHINADVFGLQEVQDTHFEKNICPLMTSLGYGSMWTPKTKIPNIINRDGCAVFYRRDKFEYIFSKQVEYYCGQNMCLDRPQIGQILRLKEKTTQKEIVIANTHILFNMKRGDIKLGQLSMLLANIRAEMDDHGEAPLIIMGDFNMDRASHLYRFLVEGSLFLKGLPRSCLASEKDQSYTPTVDLDDVLPPRVQIGRDSKFYDKKKMKPGQFPIFSVQKSKVPADTITHPFNLWAAQAPLIGRNFKDEISTYHIDAGNPDFIFYSIMAKEASNWKRTIHETPNLRLYRRVTLPTVKECHETLGPWPNKHVPSDHIPLIVEFQLRGDPQ